MKKELTLDELLADPLVLTVMRADRVHPGHVGRELRAVGRRLNNGPGFKNGAASKAVPAWLAAGRQGEACAW
ncbi:hypothetical protein KL86PLE_100522 [uncultured Pleomorphomonas sp.]|uniref:Uncharacterized protein n=1 Tax=uncultured Pleomorphomonas sp. TaxID=442121 RepID=A0A212L3Z8_9HYPH|nr:hypothetical protein [uncultured Pleomorphomonas sp.]SCM72248.1 hypothetical protein KL86PLE_100522 [uncultured Pleomorphomonas sp.]